MKSIDESTPIFCTDCGGETLVWDQVSGEVICGVCGIVIAEAGICTGPERRAFTKSEVDSRSRTGSPLSFSVHDKGLPTLITQISRDAQGKLISSETKSQMNRLRWWQIRTQLSPYVGNNLRQAMADIDMMTDKLHIPYTIKEQAAVIYRKALRKGLVRGRSIAAMADASIYAACRATKTPRTLDELGHFSFVDKKDIARCYRILVRELPLKMPVPEAQLRVPMIASKTGIGLKTQRIAIGILREAKNLKITSGKDPMGLAAASLYLASVMNDEKKTQKDIAAASGVTEVTIRNRYTELKKLLNLDIRMHRSRT